MRIAAVLVVLAGCGAHVDGEPENSAVPDASLPSDSATRDPVDAKPCNGGDARATAPDGSCLILVSALQIWTEAKATCAGLGAHAAVLTTAALDTAAETLVGNLDTFIGLTDEAKEGTFVWVDGTPLGFTNWRSGEPSNGGPGATYDENCVVISGARAGKQWDDRPCAPVPNVEGGRYAVLCQL